MNVIFVIVLIRVIDIEVHVSIQEYFFHNR